MSAGNGNLTDEELLKLSGLDIQQEKYSIEDRRRYKELMKQKKIDKFMANPDKFTDNEDIVVCVIRCEDGLMHMIQGSPLELETCFARLSRKINNILNTLEMQAELAKQKVQPVKQHGILNFVKRQRGCVI